MTIREALNAIGAKYRGHERNWLAEKNPLALKQLDALEDKIDSATLAGDIPATDRSVSVWCKTWLFWITAANRR
jgi:hypothetical protein